MEADSLDESLGLNSQVRRNFTVAKADLNLTSQVVQPLDRRLPPLRGDLSHRSDGSIRRGPHALLHCVVDAADSGERVAEHSSDLLWRRWVRRSGTWHVT